MAISSHADGLAAPHGWADPALPTPGVRRQRRLLPLVAWLACLAAAIVLLLALDGGRLQAPSVLAPSTWAPWAAAREPLEVALVLLRVLALGLAWYLVGVTTVSVLARLLRAARLVRLADALAVGPVRHVAQQAVGITLAAGVVGGTVVVPAPSAGPVGTAAPAAVQVVDGGAVETMAPLEERVATTGEEAPVPAPPVGGAPTADAAANDPAPAPDAPTAGASQGEAVSAAREVRVRPGDHLWSIAEADVARALGRTPTEAEVAAHWQAVVVANTDRLVVPGNPDLLLPGQVVVLPAVEGATP